MDSSALFCPDTIYGQGIIKAKKRKRKIVRTLKYTLSCSMMDPLPCLWFLTRSSSGPPGGGGPLKRVDRAAVLSMRVCLPFSAFLYVCTSGWCSFSLTLSVCLIVCVSIYLIVCLLSLSLSLCIYLSIFYTHPQTPTSIHAYTYICICGCVCLCVRVYIYV